MTVQKYYQIYCQTEGVPVYQWSTTVPTVCPNNPAHTIGLVQIIDENDKDLSLYDAVVAPNLENGNYTSVSQAFADGNKNVYVKNGTYFNSSNINIPANGKLVGETPGLVTIVMTGGSTVRIDGSGGIKETVGTISITSGTNTVTGVGTAFTNLAVGNYILIGELYMDISSIVNDTSLTLVNTYYGPTLTNVNYIAQQMSTGSAIRFILIVNSTGTGLYIRGGRFCNFQNVIVGKCGTNVQIIDSTDIGMQAFLFFNSPTGNGMTIDNSYNVFLNYGEIINNAGNGLAITNNSRNIKCVSGVVTSNGANGVLVDGGSGSVDFTNVNIRQNKTNGVHVTSTGGDTTVNNCNFNRNADRAVLYEGTSNLVSSCNIYDNNIGVELSSQNSICNTMVNNNSANGVNIFGNNCVCNANRVSGNGGMGIYVTGDDNIFTSNRVYANTGNGLHLDPTSDDNIVTSNNLKGNTGTNYVDNGLGTINLNNLTS